MKMGRKRIYKVREKTGPLTADKTCIAAAEILPEEQKLEKRRQKQHDSEKKIGLGRKMIGRGEDKTVIACLYGCTLSDTGLDQTQELKWKLLKIFL